MVERCHINDADSSSVLPVLKVSAKAVRTVPFKPIVHDGLYSKAKGMPAFKGKLNTNEVESVLLYLLSEARKLTP